MEIIIKIRAATGVARLPQDMVVSPKARASAPFTFIFLITNEAQLVSQ